MRVPGLFALLLGLAGCPEAPSAGGPDAATAPGLDAAGAGMDAGAPAGEDAGPDAALALADAAAAGQDATTPADAAATPRDAGAPADAGNPKLSLGACWKDPGCQRALVVCHGGDWNTGSRPFLSLPAFEEAVKDGADAIEIDVRVTKDGVPVVVHSSPFEYYESLDCGGKKVEEMTAAQVTSCHLGTSTERVQRFGDVLDWARGKLLIEADVKLTADVAAAIAEIVARGATDRAFILADEGELNGPIRGFASWEQVSYVGDVGAGAEIAPASAAAPSQHAFMLELDRSYADATQAQVSDAVKSVVHPAGLKAYTSSDQWTATVQNHLDIYAAGFDAILSYDCRNGVDAARQVNQQRGLGP